MCPFVAGQSVVKGSVPWLDAMPGASAIAVESRRYGHVGFAPFPRAQRFCTKEGTSHLETWKAG